MRKESAQEGEADVLARLRRPLFLPVFEPGNPYLTAPDLAEEFGVEGIIVNAYFLYRQRSLRRALPERGIKDHLGFHGMVMTDSGAFQAFRGRLYLRNRDIIRFQDEIGADVISPLDVVTPPGDGFDTAEGKLGVTMDRVAEGLDIVQGGMLAGVQQGGRFLELRKRAAEGLAELGVRYVALGSLVPFFTRNHDLEFAARVIADARRVLPPEVPIHLYGAGDPLELPFYSYLGCDVFDSSAFIHYAEQGAYMTPYGAVEEGRECGPEFECECPHCRSAGSDVQGATQALVRHNLWTVLDTVERVRRLREEDGLATYLEDVLAVHERWFPESALGESWSKVAIGEGGRG
ncbi:MAG: tRNA-guanine transglycosylase [Candidatus Brocadiia bacterium]